MRRIIEIAGAGLALMLAAGCVVETYPRRVVVAPAPGPVVISPLPLPLVQKAERGDAVAQFTLGSCYANGRGVPQNYRQAVSWYYLSAKQGYAPAQNRLGACYYRGLGTAQNYAAAVLWYRQAAEHGNAAAQDNLGICYYSGHGVPRNVAEAIKWYRLSAAQGNPAAVAHLRQLQSSPGLVPAANPPLAQQAQHPPTAAPTPPPTEPAESSSANQVTVDEIKELSSAGVKADTLTAQIKSTNSRFSSQDIAAAQQANVDPSVIECMKANSH